MSSLEDRIRNPGPKKLLALDGGGIRGILSLEILRKLEEQLRSATGDQNYRLADYFDFIAGNSTGAIIAATLAVGMSVDDVLGFYERSGSSMFEKAHVWKRLQNRYDSEPLAEQLRAVLGADTTLGSPNIKTLLLLMMRNATTDSPWPVWNNPYAKFNHSDLPDCNLKLPLWQLARASAAAPIYFAPETIRIGDRDFVFVDGGITVYNNPAFQMFLMATVDRYWPNARLPARPWETGTDKMLIVSVGTGAGARVNERLQPRQMNLLFNATRVPAALMFAALNEQDFLCRVFGECVFGDPLDAEVGDMAGSIGPLREKLFRFVRYNGDLTQPGLAELGCADIRSEQVQKLDSVRAIPQLHRVGKAIAEQKVRAEHLNLGIFKP